MSDLVLLCVCSVYGIYTMRCLCSTLQKQNRITSFIEDLITQLQEGEDAKSEHHANQIHS